MEAAGDTTQDMAMIRVRTVRVVWIRICMMRIAFGAHGPNRRL